MYNFLKNIKLILSVVSKICKLVAEQLIERVQLANIETFPPHFASIFQINHVTTDKTWQMCPIDPIWNDYITASCPVEFIQYFNIYIYRYLLKYFQ